MVLYSDLTEKELSPAIFNLSVENKAVQLALQIVLALVMQSKCPSLLTYHHTFYPRLSLMCLFEGRSLLYLHL